MVGWDPAARAICEAEVECDRLDCVCQILCPFRVRARLGRFSLQDVTQRAAQVESQSSYAPLDRIASRT